MKVYLVYWCNNEQWEDYSDGVSAVFSTRERAENYIIGKGCKPHVCESAWEREHMADLYDLEPDEYGYYYSMWITEKEVDE